MYLKIQGFLKNSGATAESLIRLMLLSKFNVRLPKPENNNDEVIILGNGPSLVNDLNDFPHFLKNKDLICVNHFPKTHFYESLKPSIYITTAPDLWLDDIDKRFVDQSKELFEVMREKTKWPLYFFIPFEAKKHSRWQNQLSPNKNIKFVYFNNTPIEGWDGFKFWGFKRNWGMPRPHNVMVPSIMMSIAMGYKSIYLLGADHSWLSEITVTETNDALINQKHFYDSDHSKGLPLDKGGTGKRKLHEILFKFMTAFKSYFEIEDYAKNRNVIIYNATKGSFIDAFKRFNLKKYYNDENSSI